MLHNEIKAKMKKLHLLFDYKESYQLLLKINMHASLNISQIHFSDSKIFFNSSEQVDLSLPNKKNWKRQKATSVLNNFQPHWDLAD